MTPKQTPREQLAEVVYDEAHDLWHLKCGGHYVMADESLSHLEGFAKTINAAHAAAILAVIKGLPAMQEEVVDDYNTIPGDTMRICNNKLRRQILAELGGKE